MKFDDDVMGRQRRKQAVGVSTELMDSVGIVPEKERVTKKGGHTNMRYPVHPCLIADLYKICTQDGFMLYFQGGILIKWILG